MKNIILIIFLSLIATASYASFIMQGLELQGIETGGGGVTENVTFGGEQVTFGGENVVH